MARRLGVSLRTYDRWEAGSTVPRGDILLKIIDLCPDDDTRSLFRSARPSERNPSGKGVAAIPVRRFNASDRLRMRLRNSCLEAIRIIYESAVLGSAAADEKLRSYAGELNRTAAMLVKFQQTTGPILRGGYRESGTPSGRPAGAEPLTR